MNRLSLQIPSLVARHKSLFTIGFLVYLATPLIVVNVLSDSIVYVGYFVGCYSPLVIISVAFLFIESARKKSEERIRGPFKFIRQKHFSHETTPKLAAIRGAEIGVHRGRHASRILDYLNLEKLYLVDSWEGYTDHGIEGFPDDEQEEVYREVIEKFKHRENVELIRKDSLAASNLVEDLTLDFVYIDANHEYEYVLADLKAWYPKLKNDGVLCGDDFGHPSSKGLIRAVTEFAYEKKLLVFSEKNQFFMVKS